MRGAGRALRLRSRLCPSGVGEELRPYEKRCAEKGPAGWERVAAGRDCAVPGGDCRCGFAIFPMKHRGGSLNVCFLRASVLYHVLVLSCSFLFNIVCVLTVFHLNKFCFM